MARKKQETLVLFPEVLSVTRKLSDEQFGVLMRAAFSYRLNGEIYDGEDVAVDVAFQFVSNQIDRYMESCAINGRNAAGSNAEGSEMQRNPTKCQRNPTPIQSISSPILSNPIESDADKPPHTHFLPPSVEEVRQYCSEQGYSVDPDRFVSYYKSNGWMVGKNRMKDWKATVDNWDRRDYSENLKEVINNGETYSKPTWTVGTVV